MSDWIEAVTAYVLQPLCLQVLHVALRQLRQLRGDERRRSLLQVGAGGRVGLPPAPVQHMLDRGIELVFRSMPSYCIAVDPRNCECSTAASTVYGRHDVE